MVGLSIKTRTAFHFASASLLLPPQRATIDEYILIEPLMGLGICHD